LNPQDEPLALMLPVVFISPITSKDLPTVNVVPTVAEPTPIPGIYIFLSSTYPTIAAEALIVPCIICVVSLSPKFKLRIY
jgi:hypothetical protein